MKRLVQLFIILFVVGLALSSCRRGGDLEAVKGMPEGSAKDTAMLYYYYGLKQGYVLVATDSFYINTQPKSQFSGKKEIRPEYKGIKNYEMPVDDYRGARVFAGDTLEVLGGFKREVMKNKKERDFVQVRIIRDGKKVADGWNWHHISQMKLPYTAWSSIFSSNGVERMENIMSIILIALAVVVVYGLWKLVYWIIVDKIRSDDCFWQRSTIVTKALYYIAALLVGFLYFLIDLNEPMTYALRFNPDFFAHWAEYPLYVKMLPFVAGLWGISAVGMLAEMIRKFNTPWLIIYYPGVLAIGLLIVAGVIMASWLIYILLPTIIAVVVTMFAGGADNATGGMLSGGGGKRLVVGKKNGQTVYEGDGIAPDSK